MTTNAVLTGVGQSEVGRRLGRSGMSLTSEAVLAALADAGLDRADIDGVSTWPGAHSPAPGFSGAGVFDVVDAFGLNVRWFSGGSETAGQLGAVMNAVAAVEAGLARHVLVFRTVWESTATTLAQGRRASVVGSGSARVSGWTSYLVPFGAMSAATWAALYATRHMHDFGTTREQLGWLAVIQRQYAGLNPKAVYTDPLTLEDYLAARPIAEPLGLYDCDVPVDGSTAFIVSRADATSGLNAPGVRIEALSSALGGRPDWFSYGDGAEMMATEVGRDLWTRTDLQPSDVDCAQLYDGFTIFTLMWLEALGLVPRGEAGPFVEGGTRIDVGGDLPVNTSGGQLSAGRLHGFGHLHEACLQLRGEAGHRQVFAAEVAVVAAGGGPLAGALLLTRER
ncbi:thiolase family protein [Sporichthya polymorpha]|uniref:thiolase family protein n=1 Tax=Sporichthya polymorpha TaxID=35751 RepID=UPI0003612DDA|nr:thiolase family protein [Sporichthya polymorpha]